MQSFPNMSLPPASLQSYPSQGVVNSTQSFYPAAQSSQSYQGVQQNQATNGSQAPTGFSLAPSTNPSLSHGDHKMGYDPNLSPVYVS